MQRDLFEQRVDDTVAPDWPGTPVKDAHEHTWIKTTTVWPGESIERLTWTCSGCGRVRGRV